MGFKDWGFFPYVADRLARAGLAVVSFNFSGAGVGDGSDTFEEPERFGHNTYTNELRDLDIVLDALTQGAFGFQLSAYGLFGHSAGGTRRARPRPRHLGGRHPFRPPHRALERRAASHRNVPRRHPARGPRAAPVPGHAR